ncbi:MAG: hypothetical protein CPDRYMAC_0226 [uncultured Paraburkholderia sp.]|nr:MAG: hypothetical protein CPDRYDRY_0225 [uncultured Paraburkholderia sp.]CAH2910492.1 MAG: hypothetical protein CPDRYMAC_0226 [uncultured Paraburkholderia sp.]
MSNSSDTRRKRNGAGQSESDSKSTAFFHRSVPVNTAALSNAPILVAAARSDHPIVETRNAGHAKR